MWLIAAAGCNGDGVTLDGSTHSGAPDCDGAVPFTLDLEATTPSGVTVGFVSAEPAVPDVGDNTWTLSLVDAEGPVSGAAPRLIPWMPLHGHGLVPAEYVGIEGPLGEYALPTFDLVMPGLWELTVDLAPVGAPADAVVFALCAEG